MDRTLVSHHSGGSVSSSQLTTFVESLTPASRRLIPELLSEGFQIGVATFADDLYASFGRGDTIAGVELVQLVLKELPYFQTNSEALEQVPIVTLNPDLYTNAVQRATSSAAAQEEQRRMKTRTPSSASSASSSTSPSSFANQLETFFHAKLNAFGLDSNHAEWDNCAIFPPLGFKNTHLRLISAKLGLKLSEVLLIDDRDENVEAAVESGAHGLILTKKRGLLIEDLREKNMQLPNTNNTNTQGR